MESLTIPRGVHPFTGHVCAEGTTMMPGLYKSPSHKDTRPFRSRTINAAGVLAAQPMPRPGGEAPLLLGSDSDVALLTRHPNGRDDAARMPAAASAPARQWNLETA